MIRAVTVDFWGTLMFDPPSSDNRYKQKRLMDFETILRSAGLAVTPKALDRAYEESGRFLGRLWRTCKDVSVQGHVAAILEAVEPGLPGRLGSGALAALVQAYANPALLVPPTPDLSAGGALAALAAQGTILCVIANTMRTPGVVLRKVLDRYGLLAPFKLLTFSDECGVRKPDPEIFHLTLRQISLAPAEAGGPRPPGGPPAGSPTPSSGSWAISRPRSRSCRDPGRHLRFLADPDHRYPREPPAREGAPPRGDRLGAGASRASAPSGRPGSRLRGLRDCPHGSLLGESPRPSVPGAGEDLPGAGRTRRDGGPVSRAFRGGGGGLHHPGPAPPAAARRRRRGGALRPEAARRDARHPLEHRADAGGGGPQGARPLRSPGLLHGALLLG